MTTRHEFLGIVHERLQPRGYIEVGINTGASLTLSRTRSVAVDPNFKITCELHCDLQVAKATSDDFFARDDALGHLPGSKADLSLIDGMHLFEFALRDFINVERASNWTSVIVVDDVLPRSIVEANRDRTTVAWTGDVYKLTDVLRRLRPDLILLPVDTLPTGVLVVLGANPDSTVLRDHLDDLVAELIVPDPQDVPHGVLSREGTVVPSSVLDSDIWSRLVEMRESGVGRDEGLPMIRALVDAAAKKAEKRELTAAALRTRPPANSPYADPAAAKDRRTGAKKKTAAKKAAVAPGLIPAAKRRLRPIARSIRRRLRRG